MFTEERYKSLLNASCIEPDDKLFILHLFGEKSDYAHLITPVIGKYHVTACIEERRRIRALLYRVLGNHGRILLQNTYSPIV